MDLALQKEKGRGGKTFLLALLAATLLFLPFVIMDRGYFVYFGDFNAQQIPFYQLAHDTIRGGTGEWSFLTDLGANFVGSYSFYLLGSPFFWLTVPFPSSWVPYLMAPLLILKLALAATTAYAYCRRFLSPRYSSIAGILYAFSGISIYNIFFNHFLEPMIVFPLMLLGMEQYMKEGRRGLFPVAVLLGALVNYYFFIGQALFLMIYWCIRAGSGEWEHKGRRFFGLWLQAILGTACAAILLLPSYYAVVQNGRTGDLLEGMGFLVYGTGQRLYDILHCFLFPPEIVSRANFFPDANNKWASMSAWLPVFGCTGVIAYFQSRHHRDWLRRALTVLFICAIVPGLNAAFQLFNAMYYARWYYMMVLLLALATMRCFEGEEEVNWPRALGWAGGMTAFFTIFIGIIPKSWTPDEETGKLVIGSEKYTDWFWLYVAIAALCLTLTALLVQMHGKDRARFPARCLAVCTVGALCFGWFYVGTGKYISNYPADYVIDKLIESDGFDLPADGFCRTDMNAGMDNQGIYWKMPCIQAFHSVVPGSVMEFYQSVGVTRTVGSRPDADHYALRGLLSVRYLFDYCENEGDIVVPARKKDDDGFVQNGETKMPGWEYVKEKNGFAVYENTDFIPMGFTYDGYVLRSEYDELSNTTKELLLLKALIVEDRDEKTVATLLPHLAYQEMSFTVLDYDEDCTARRATAATSFVTDADGFTATLKADKPNYVFFSVPFEKGWSATVNGKPAAILKTNVGFMAVACPAGENVTVRFTYRTPGLRLGGVISAVALLILILYLFCCIRPNRRIRRETACPLPPPPAREPEGTPEPPRPAPSFSDDNSAGEDDFDLYTFYPPARK